MSLILLKKIIQYCIRKKQGFKYKLWEIIFVEKKKTYISVL